MRSRYNLVSWLHVRAPLASAWCTPAMVASCKLKSVMAPGVAHPAAAMHAAAPANTAFIGPSALPVELGIVPENVVVVESESPLRFQISLQSRASEDFVVQRDGARI